MGIEFKESSEHPGYKKIMGYELYFGHGLFRSKSNKNVYETIKNYNNTPWLKGDLIGAIKYYLKTHKDNPRTKLGKERVEAAKKIELEISSNSAQTQTSATGSTQKAPAVSEPEVQQEAVPAKSETTPKELLYGEECYGKELGSADGEMPCDIQQISIDLHKNCFAEKDGTLIITDDTSCNLTASTTDAKLVKELSSTLNGTNCIWIKDISVPKGSKNIYIKDNKVYLQKGCKLSFSSIDFEGDILNYAEVETE